MRRNVWVAAEKVYGRLTMRAGPRAPTIGAATDAIQEVPMTHDTSTPFTRLVGCRLAIQLAPIGAAGQDPRLLLAVAGAGGHAVYPAVF